MLAHKASQLDFESSDLTGRMAHLRAVSLFADIEKNPQALERLAAVFETRSYYPGQTIIEEGQSGTDMFLLVGGTASVYKRTTEGDRYKVAILRGESRAFFGEGALLEADSRSATIVADEPCRCLVLGREAFWSFSRDNAEWAMPILLRIASTVMSRLRKTNEDLSLLYNALVAEIRGR